MTARAAASFVVLRSPLLSFDTLEDLSRGLQAPDALRAGGESAGLARALQADRELLRLRLCEVYRRPIVAEALRVASPALHKGLAAWEEQPESEEGRAVERALLRYLTRMAARPTPFGLFAGCTLGGVGAPARLALSAGGELRRRSRLDMDYLARLFAALHAQEAIRRRLRYTVNSSLFLGARRFRLVESVLTPEGRRHHLVAVEDSSALRRVLEEAAHPVPFAELVERLAAAEDVEAGEAVTFVEELIESQILVPELELPVTGIEPLDHLLQCLRQVEAPGPAVPVLESVRVELEALDREPAETALPRYAAVTEQLATLEVLGVPVDPARLIQVDLMKPAPGLQVDARILAEIERGAEVLWRSTPARAHPELERFREEFVRRYEGREVPLLEVLDEELGIGFERNEGPQAEVTPLLAGLALPPPAGENRVPFGPREAFLLENLLRCEREGWTEWVLDPQDVARLEHPSPLPLPDAFAVTATLLAPSPEALAGGEFRVLVHGLAGPNGATLLGRFCHLDPALEQCVREHLAAEERLHPEVVFAEIVHLPEGRMGNILFRPVLRGYEVPFLGRSGAPRERQIPVQDLTVAVQGARIVLRSQRMRREVRVRLTTAHNYAGRNLGLYRFLCALQHQGAAKGVSFHWGPLENAPFLPAVRVGRVQLARARWLVPHEEHRAFHRLRGADLYRAVQEWRARRRLPRHVLLAELDNELWIDLDSVLSVETLAALVRRRGVLTLRQPPAGPDDLVVTGPGGRYTHELVVPFTRAPAGPAAAGPVAVPVAEAVAVPRSFALGSAWLYAKVYTGTSSADGLLRDEVAPLIRELRGAGWIERWFFLRYGDPDWHLRLRLCGRPEVLVREVLPRVAATLARAAADGRVQRVQWDTYEREVERYGGAAGIALAEAWFEADSDLVLELLRLHPGDAGMEARWRLGLLGCDRVLEDLGLALPEKTRLAGELRERHAEEFGAGKDLSSQLAHKLRKHRAELLALLEAGPAESGDLAAGLAALRARSQASKEPLAELRRRAGAGSLTTTLPALAASFLHMHLNRLLRSAARAQELVLYDFLQQLYRSQLARRTDARGFSANRENRGIRKP